MYVLRLLAVGRLSDMASHLTDKDDRATLTARDFQFAVRLMLPDELAKRGVSEGSKAVAKYTLSRGAAK